MIRVAFISDIHFGRDSHPPPSVSTGNGTRGLRFKELLDVTRERLAGMDAIICLGDLIWDETPEMDRKNLLETVRMIRDVGPPAYFVLGNHDMRSFAPAEAANIVGMESTHYTFEIAGHAFAVATVENRGKDTLFLPDEQIEWLKTIPEGAIFLNHFPLDEQDYSNSPYAPAFNANPGRAQLRNRDEIRQILADRKVKLAVNGHFHWHNLTVHSSTMHLTVGSFTEVIGEGVFCGWTELHLDGDKMQITPHNIVL